MVNVPSSLLIGQWMQYICIRLAPIIVYAYAAVVYAMECTYVAGYEVGVFIHRLNDQLSEAIKWFKTLHNHQQGRS